MLYVAGENLLPILIALLIGFLTGLWIWKFARRPDAEPKRVLTEEPAMRRPYVENRPPAPTLDRATRTGPRPEPEVLARRVAREPEDSTVISGAAAAIEDVADQFLGIDAHAGAQSAPGTAQAAGDDLQVMKGVGPKLAGLLRAEGITRFDQIAALTSDDLTRLDAHLGAFKGRLSRDRIVEQAAFLATGDKTGYEAAFGRI